MRVVPRQGRTGQRRGTEIAAPLAGSAGIHDPAADIGRRVPALEHRRGWQAVRYGDAGLQGYARARGHLEDHRVYAGRLPGYPQSSGREVMGMTWTEVSSCRTS